jgi:competence protein ComEA
MKKLLLILVICFTFVGSAFAAVDLNTATQAQLESVNGIGPVKARAIIEYRARNAPFKNVDDLASVKGFGKKTVDKVRSEVTVGGGSSARPAAGDKKNTEKKK